MDSECSVLNLLDETGAYLIWHGAASKEKPEQKLNQPKPGGHQTAHIPQRGMVLKGTPVGCCFPSGLGITPLQAGLVNRLSGVWDPCTHLAVRLARCDCFGAGTAGPGSAWRGCQTGGWPLGYKGTEAVA